MTVCLAPLVAHSAAPKRAVEPSQEQRDLVRALRSIETRVEVGMDLGAFSQELGNLAVAVATFSEAQRSDANLRRAANDVLVPFKDASTVWTACTRGCDYGLIVLDGAIEPAIERFVADLLRTYPKMNALTEDGGVRMDGKRVHYSRLVGALLAVGAERARALRTDLLR